jgi:hypothetical protein
MQRKQPSGRSRAPCGPRANFCTPHRTEEPGAEGRSCCRPLSAGRTRAGSIELQRDVRIVWPGGRVAALIGGGLRAALYLGAIAPVACDAAQLQDLRIVSGSGAQQHFEVELADSSAERARGLMRRRELAPRNGMLFDFERDDRVAMWMRNTYLALDMLFIDAEGRIQSIVEHTRPLSAELIWSPGPVRAVLELNAGAAREFGVAPGDQVYHPMFE